MAYVGTPYKNDIFISYATESNDAGWVDHFRERLEKGVTNKLALLEDEKKTRKGNRNYKIGIWFDQNGRMHGNHAVTKQLSDGVRSSATLIIIVSKHYWRSVWPIDERTWFNKVIIDDADPDKKVFFQNRVFIVKQEDCLPEALPECFLGDDGVPLLGYRFFDDNSKTIWPKTDNDAWSRSFLQAMESLEEDMAERLWEIRHNDIRQEPILPEKPAVFLGHVNKYLTKLRAEIRKELEGQGVVVLPPKDQDFMYDMALLRSAFSNFLDSATIFVQLLDENCGDWPPENPLGTIGFQMSLVDAQRPKLSTLKFVTSCLKQELDLLGASDEYRRYLTEAASSSPHATAIDSPTICDAIVAELKTLLDSKNRGRAQAFQLTTVGATSDAIPPKFLMSFLQSLVANHPGLIPGIIPAGSKAEDIRGAIEASDVVIMLWKDKSMPWLRHQLSQILMNPEMILNNKSDRKRNIIVIYPDKPAAFPIFTTEFYVVIDCVNNSEAEVRAKILEDISSWLTPPPAMSMEK